MNVNYVFLMLCGLWLSMAAEQRRRCSKEDSEMCAADEFFDINVCLCSSCADICQLKPDKTTDSLCQYSCPGYHKQTNISRHSLSPKESRLSSTSVALLQVHEDNSLVKKPLFWTSVVSVLISVMATVILVVLCTCKKSRSTLAFPRIRRMPLSQIRMPAKGANEKSECSTGMLRNAEEANDPLLTSEKNLSKDKCGMFALSEDHAVTLDSCAIDHDTIASLCHSSYLRKPCVASFEDFDFLSSNETMCLFSMDDYDRRDTSVTSVNVSTNTNAMKSTVISMQRRLENLEGRSPFEGSEKPLQAIEGCTSESGYFNSNSCKSVTNWKEDSPDTCAVYTIHLSSRKVTDKKTKRHCSYHAQETHTLKDERNSVANWKYYTAIPQRALHGSESKATGVWWHWDSGMKPSISSGRKKDLTCNESALQESSEETRLKQMPTAIYCILNNMSIYNCSASHLESSCDRYVPATDLSLHDSKKQGDGKQLPELNLKMRSGADTVKSEPDILNVEVRNSSERAEDSNEEDTILKTQKLNTYPRAQK